MPLYAVDGCNIVTSDGIGSIKHGYDNIHKKLAEHGATQCGYCTPGFAMAMYRFAEIFAINYVINSGKKFFLI